MQTSRRNRRTIARTALPFIAVAVLACAERTGRDVDSGGADSTTATAASPAVDSAPLAPVSWRFEPPASWDDRVRVADDPEGAARLAAQGIRSARLFEYLPRDTSIVAQTLLGIYAYDSTAWARLAAEDGPPQGDLLGYEGGVAYVAGLPQSNPFAPGSADFGEFERRSVTLDFVRRAFRIVP
jgi:hypothetical protein